MFKQSTRFADLGGRLKSVFPSFFSQSNGKNGKLSQRDLLFDIMHEEVKDTLDKEHLKKLREKRNAAHCDLDLNKSKLGELVHRSELPATGQKIGSLKAQISTLVSNGITTINAKEVPLRNAFTEQYAFKYLNNILEPRQQRNTLFLLAIVAVLFVGDAALVSALLVSDENTLFLTFTDAFGFAAGISFLNVGFSTFLGGFLCLRYLKYGTSSQKLLSLVGLFIVLTFLGALHIEAAGVRLTGSLTNIWTLSDSFFLFALMNNVRAFGVLLGGILISALCMWDGFNLAGPPKYQALAGAVNQILNDAEVDRDELLDNVQEIRESIEEEVIPSVLKKRQDRESQCHDVEFNHYKSLHAVNALDGEIQGIMAEFKTNGQSIPELSSDDRKIDISSAVNHQFEASVLVSSLQGQVNDFIASELKRYNNRYESLTQIPEQIRQTIEKRIKQQRSA